MRNNLRKTNPGFTIIEVVLVLAIAGLIFLMVFLALPALQRSQRDTQRRDDLAGFSTQITNYQSNNRGKVPDSTQWNDFLKQYMKQDGDKGEFIDPDGTPYTVKQVDLKDYKAPTDFDHIIYVIPGAKCEGETPTKATGSTTRQLAFTYKLEGGGIYCNSNS